jgi:uncharacterized protein YndB with AHSA1/START domain
MKRDLHFEREYPYSPEQIWRALTDSKAIAEWLMDNDFQPVVGRKFQFHTKPAPGFDGVVNCEVLEVESPRRLVYSWQGGPMKRPTTVIWTLEPAGSGTRLTLDHNGFEGVSGILLSIILGSGWGKLFRQGLADVLSRMQHQQ